MNNVWDSIKNFHTWTETENIIAYYFNFLDIIAVFPGSTSGQELPWKCSRHKRRGFHPCVGKMTWSRKWQPTPVFLPGESHVDKGVWQVMVHGVTQSRIRLKQCSHENNCLFKQKQYQFVWVYFILNLKYNSIKIGMGEMQDTIRKFSYMKCCKFTWRYTVGAWDFHSCVRRAELETRPEAKLGIWQDGRAALQDYQGNPAFAGRTSSWH